MKTEDLYCAVGQRIRKAREARNLSQADLANVVSLTRTSITNIECGKQKPLLHTLYDIADALGVDPRSFLPEASESTKPVQLDSNSSEKLSKDEQEWVLSVITRLKERG